MKDRRRAIAWVAGAVGLGGAAALVAAAPRNEDIASWPVRFLVALAAGALAGAVAWLVYVRVRRLTDARALSPWALAIGALGLVVLLAARPFHLTNEDRVARACNGRPSSAIFRPLGPGLSYGDRDVRTELELSKDVRGHPFGDPVARPVLRHGRKVGLVVVIPTSEPRGAIAGVRHAIASNAVQEPYQLPLGEVRWTVGDYRRGSHWVSAIGCHLVQVRDYKGGVAEQVANALSNTGGPPS
jgi:hypothetical protein